MIVFLPLLICIIGALVFALSNNANIKVLARDMFWTGLLVTLLNTAHMVTLPH